MALIWIVILIFVLYGCLILMYWKNWDAIPLFNSPVVMTGELPRVSIIIPARNEEKNIGRLLNSLHNQDYPGSAFEIIVIDDDSIDRTADIVRQFPGVRLVSLKEDGINAYKKRAIETGIAMASGEIVITTDADCEVPPHWLETVIACKLEMQAVFIAGPVVIQTNRSLLQLFQAMDFMVLQGITGAGVYRQQLTMCNGANLAYEKRVFDEVDGFQDVDHIASGDDMLLMYKVWKKYPGQVVYLKSKSAIVSTQPMFSWKDFFNQRIRWASKANHYNDKRIFPVLLLVYLFNLSFLVLLVAGFFNAMYWIAFLSLWLGKTLVELPFFISISAFFDRKWMARLFILFQPLHILYTIIAGLFGQLGSYEWKGRRVK
jgi:cellulose synthase/poly-beta-1,6-N-acetylglucosamine synthase-like glycosyltransferase